MFSLIPRDCWEHSLFDSLRGLKGALFLRSAPASLHIRDIGECVPVQSGRAALLACLRALPLPPKARIGVPLYCCPVVFEAISAAGCVPVFLDIDPATFCLSPEHLRARRHELDALVAVHMFGNLCDIPGMQAAAPGLPIIEDCAQALGTKLDSRPAGTLGTAAIFSFRSGKYLSVGEGGAAFSPDKLLLERIREVIASFPTHSLLNEIKHVFVCYLKSLLRSQPLYGLFGYKLWQRRNSTSAETAQNPVAGGKIHKSDAAMISSRLSRLDSQIARQRANFDHLLGIVGLSPISPVEPDHAFYNRYLLPLLFRTPDERDSVADFLLSQGVDTMKYLKGTVKMARSHFGYQNDCPHAEELIDRVLVVPNYHRLKPSELDKVFAALRQALNRNTAETTKRAPGSIQERAISL